MNYCCAIDTTMMDNIRISNPMTNTLIVLDLTPFHSLRIIPHTLEKITFNDMRILQEKA